MGRMGMGRMGVGVLVSAMGLGGCATLTRGMRDEVAVISDPPGAVVTTTLGTGCAATPCTLDVARDAVFTVTVSKSGYGSLSVAVGTRLSGTGAALTSENIATAGLGVVVDAATGAVLEHVPNPVSVTLPGLPHPPSTPVRVKASTRPAS